ncbi:MAG TPA: beta-galactosidase trimerization domain-containing protein [Candidatus Limnocylindria bacterium]|nr:beta-galactosidase trimerization domain-containing protein [Candidatus Limnocylindria bacterium]
MNQLTRRELLQSAGLLLVTPQLRAALRPAAALSSAYEWIRSTRVLIAEAYNPPFYPSLDYEPEKAVRIAQELNADSLRYPVASYYAYFPTKSGYPVHPELRGDPMRQTVDLCRKANLKNVAYVPLNHPFMEVTSKDPRFAGWSKKFADGRPMTTEHYGFVEYYEGCLNSPVRDVIKALVREVLLDYPFDVMYFDGPYQGMQNAQNYCHCSYCDTAYQKKFGKPVPKQNETLSREDEIQYTNWMANDVVVAFLREIREIIRQTRDIPVLYNDTSLLSKREWRSRAIPVVDGFMFEAAETPEEKLFNMQLGQSTGKVTWTYVGTHTQYNREHLKNERVRGWFSYPVESQELLLDGATALAAGVGLVYWGLSRFFYQPERPLSYESGRYVKRIFDFQQEHDVLLRSVRSQPQVGLLVGSQTVNWYAGKYFVSRAYQNCWHGAYQLLKANSYESEPFLDWQMSPQLLSRYQMLYAPNVACLSDSQCLMLLDYVRGGGALLATHLTSVADEYGRMRKNYGLAEVFGAEFSEPEPVEIPDLYLKLPSGEEIPQDPQVLRFRENGGTVLAETLDRGHRRTLGPAIIQRSFGKGSAIYIGSSLEAVYEETRMKSLRVFFNSLVSPWLSAQRSYEIEYQSGVTPHFMASRDVLLLHLLADTGNKNKHLRSREEFLPVADVKVRIRIPQQRSVRSALLLLSGQTLPSTVRDGWLEVAVPRVWIHEAVKVDLA